MIKYLIIVFIIIFPSVAFPANHYVRDGGSGDGSSWSSAWDNLPSSLIRGDTYYVADGSYGSYTFDDATSGSSYITIKKATASDHGTSTGWSSSYGDGVAIFSGFSITTNYWVIDGNVTDADTYGFAVNFGGGSGQAVNLSSSHIQLKSIRWDGQVANHARCLRMYTGGSDVLVQHAEFDQCGNDAVMWHLYDDVTIDDIWIHDRDTDDDTHADAFELYGKSGASYTIKNSRIDWGGQQVFFSGVVSQHGTWHIYGNRFYNTSGSNPPSCKGIHPHSSNPTVAVYVYNNTFEGLYYAHDLQSNSSGAVKNNIYYNLGPGKVGGFGSASHDYNYFQTSLGGYSESHAQLGGDPFVAIGSNDYQLSGATNAGDSGIGATYNTDPVGNIRGADGTWDRGAYEYVSGGADATPPVITIDQSDPQNIGSDNLEITGNATDAAGTIGACKYRIGAEPDASNGIACAADDGTFNGANEDFTCSTSDYSVGANTLYIECDDDSGNWSTGNSITINYNPDTISGIQISWLH